MLIFLKFLFLKRLQRYGVDFTIKNKQGKRQKCLTKLWMNNLSGLSFDYAQCALVNKNNQVSEG